MLKIFPDALEVRGSHKRSVKKDRLKAFGDGNNRMMITKPSIAGFGMNWQHCTHQISMVNYSFEKFYQAVGRSHRFGVQSDVNFHFVLAESEGNVLQAIKDKQKQFKAMQLDMTKAMYEHGLFRDNKRHLLSSQGGNTMQLQDWLIGD